MRQHLFAVKHAQRRVGVADVDYKKHEFSDISRTGEDNAGDGVLSSGVTDNMVMLLFLHGEIFLFIPGVFSLAGSALLLVALKNVAAIKRSTVLSAVALMAAILFMLAAIFLIWSSEFW